ncbi:hypothetical protein M3484_09305 [Pseudomonas sp. GX19020]|uniref:hypothetical protein n=1 Tax=Pseudomonas sp. GX19020 TaxID=2942277 RepID=UPI0020198466|nr:hypothetical protein [Pseudomonas sp. GX19020]MCL4066768.1 hypothetical protein [Pseudomonas sp. GX19020]
MRRNGAQKWQVEMAGRMWKAGALVLSLAAGMAHAAADWATVPDDRVETVLAARTIGFPDGVTWGFFADGRVLSGETWGRWSLGDETVCLLWPGAEAVCYRLDEKGIDLRFTPVSGGAARVGRYIDL